MSTSRCSAAIAILIVMVFLPIQSFAQYVYNEDFTSTTFEDTMFTVADWNTVDGELKLFPLPLLTGSYTTPGIAVDVAIAGDLAFVSDRSTGLQIIDISNPTSLTFVGAYDTPGDAYGVAVAGDLAFVADMTSGLQIIDISNPASPSLVGTYNTPGTARKVAVAGDLAFVADVSGGLQIIDISDPASPAFVSSAALSGNTYGVAVAGNLAFAADGTFGLRIVDITTPSSLALIGTLNTTGVAVAVRVEGDMAFLAASSIGGGLQIIDITDPTSPVLIGAYDTAGNPSNVAVSGDLAFVTDGSAGLEVIDISNPASPALAGSYDTPVSADGVVVAGEHAWVADHGNLEALRVARLTPPTLIGSAAIPDPVAVTVVGDLAFVVDWYMGLQITDISNPANPTLVGTYDMPDLARKVTVAGNLAFVADDTSGVQIIDITNPASPAFVGNYDTVTSAYAVTVAGDLAFVATPGIGFGLQIIDISNPASPVLVGKDGTGTAYDVVVEGDLAFVAGSDFRIVDISNPASPTVVGNYSTPGIAIAVAVQGDLAFVGENASGFEIIDISNPASPTFVGSYPVSGPTRTVTVAGDLAFVSDTFTLHILDITNPASPVSVGTYDPIQYVYGVAVAGDFAFVATLNLGLEVLQVLQHEVDTSRDVGQSVFVDGADDTIVRARLTATETSGVSWVLSADGVNGQGFVPNTWALFNFPGTDLRWRADLAWSPGVNPTVSDLTIEWLNDIASITAITDVPNDQGGRVYVTFMRSGYDFAEETTNPVTQYGIYRRVDNAALTAEVVSRFATNGNIGPGADGIAQLPGVETAWINGTRYVQGSSAALTAFPAGTWALVQTVPATQSDNYVAEVTTEADSTTTGTNNSVYIVTTHTTTPSVWFVSHPDSGYSVDNIAPGVPQAFAVAYNTGSGNTLAWDDSPEPDFQYYRVYRSSDRNFTPAPGNLVHETATPGWTDPDYDGGMVYYKVTALDYSGNESDPASAGTMTAVPDVVVPESFALHQNYPNPFNPTTVITYDVPRGGAEVTLRIYDVSGRLVRTLVDGPQAEGQQHATWDGRDGAARQVSTGTYFYRLTAPGFEQTRKMVLLK